MSTVALALGSNMGDSLELINQSVEQLTTVMHITGQAPIYTSRPVGVTDQPDFFNTAITGTTNLTPHELLAAVKSIEQQVGRVERYRWGPREIDIDIIFYDDSILDSPELIIPHPQMSQREFVLRPLADINDELIDPVSKQSVGQLLDQLSDSNRSVLRRL